MDLQAYQLFAFYGSLRMGMYNYQIYEKALQYEFSARLSGYGLFSLGDYPAAYKSNSDQSIVVEMFRIQDLVTAKEIHALELDAGYFIEKIKFMNFDVGIYLMDWDGKAILVDSGDWVQYGLARQGGNN